MGTKTLTNDLVVVLPGIMGSTLAKEGELVWAPSAGAVLRAIATFGRSIKGMTLPAGIGDDHPGDGVEPVALMPDLHILPGIWTAHVGYGELLKWLGTHLIPPSPEIPSLLPVAYDWRLSNRYNGRRLKKIVEPALERWRAQGGPYADAKLIFICHSMGGIVARWYIEMEGGLEFTRKLVTLGTPYRGALNALDQLVNSVRKGFGPLKLDLTDFARSLPSVHQLLPEYACIESPTGLLKTTETNIPDLQTVMLADAMGFHDEMDQQAENRPSADFSIHPIVGVRQPTYTTARIFGNTVIPVQTIHGDDLGGDATVPRLSAAPKNIRPDAAGIHYVADQHSALQNNQAVFDQLYGILTGSPMLFRAAPRLELGVRMEPVILAGEKIHVEVMTAGDERISLQVRVMDEQGKEVRANQLSLSGRSSATVLEPLPPGAYRIVTAGAGSMAAAVAPVTSIVLVLEKE